MSHSEATVNSILARVLQIRSPAERGSFLEEVCAGDASLRSEIERLLKSIEQTGVFMDRPAASPVDPAGTVEQPSIMERAGSIIGPYKLLQQIGEGGMGVVFMAEQEAPIRRRVALKIIKPGMDSQQVIARFEAERQALAMMDHANIARVFDAGATAGGRPYFVMELVHGVPITTYCDENKLTPRERLELFIPVCQAIQHAHQKGVIHRDVKPSNVLVTMYDDRPVPKVIDFGVAKAVEQRLTEKTLFTQYGALVGTFEYMSPEQAEMNAFGVDTRSNVYSLGVLLYELLTGATPLAKQRLRSAGLAELVRLIREEEPVRPSAKLGSSGDLPRIAAARRTDPARLAGVVKGEVDWIVMKCLEKDRTRRYQTANGLARDLERYLGDEPVEACPPSARYRLGKFVRRHYKALVTAAAFAGLLLVTSAASTWLAVAAAAARQDANSERFAAEAAEKTALSAKATADEQRDEARRVAYASGIGLAQRACEENNFGRARDILRELPTEAAGRTLRGFEWFYLSRLCEPEEMTLQGHEKFAWNVVFSPDGRLLASGGADDTIRVWDAASGKQVLIFRDANSFAGFSFSPDSRRLAFATRDDSLRIVDCAAGGEVRWQPSPASPIRSVAFSPDGRSLASASDDRTAVVWNAASGDKLLTLQGHSGPVKRAAFSSDGGRLVTASDDGSIKLWDVATGKNLFTVRPRIGWIIYSVFSPDLKRLAAKSSDGKVTIWDGTDGKELFAVNGSSRSDYYTLSFGPDGRRVALLTDGKTVKIWDGVDGKDLFAVSRSSRSDSFTLSFSPDGLRIALLTDDESVKILNSSTGEELCELKSHSNIVSSLAFSPDGLRLASGGWDHTVKVWDCASGRELYRLRGHSGGVNRVSFSPDGRRLASAGWDRTVRIWDEYAAKDVFAIQAHSVAGVSVAFSPDGERLVSTSLGPSSPKVWDSSTGKLLLLLKGHADRASCAAFSPDGRYIATAASDKKVKIWQSATGKLVRTLEGHTGSVWSLSFSPDGRRLASGSWDRTVKIWNVDDGKLLLELKRDSGSVPMGGLRVAFSPDGSRVAATNNDRTVGIWDSATGVEQVSLVGHDDTVEMVAFSPDGLHLASASDDHTVKIWDFATGREVLTLVGHADRVWCVAFSPDGRRLASGSSDGTLKLWDAESGRELFSAQTHDTWVRSVAFSPDGRRLASANFDGTIHVRELTDVSNEVKRRRVLNQVVGRLFGELHLRVDVLERLQREPGLVAADREEAVALAQSYPLDPDDLNHAAWQSVRYPGADRSVHLQAVRFGEAACQLEPNNRFFVNTLGVAHYRLGEYQQALELLMRCEEINKSLLAPAQAVDLAFLAMTHHKLGHSDAARAAVERLRQRSLTPETQTWLHEAEATMAKPATPEPAPRPEAKQP